MKHSRRARLSAAQKASLWQRWERGQSLTEIGQALGYHTASVFHVLRGSGGFPPPERRRAMRTLSLIEREEISRGLAAGWSLRRIARGLRRAPSTVSREVNRHCGRRRYRASDADHTAWRRAQRPKQCLFTVRPRLRDVVASRLTLQWSPEQIAGWLEDAYPDDQTMRVSHETIYRSLFIQARGVLKKELLGHLRSRRQMRRPKGSRPVRGGIPDLVSIRERPAQVEDRAVPGHWEGDLLCGGRHSQIATLVERNSRFVVLVKLPTKDTKTVVEALSQKVCELPLHLRRSLTWDRGSELAGHKDFTVATDVKVYFCDPHSPWQRGSNENTNGLLRQYFPHGTDLSQFSQADLDAVALRLNQRPRKTLGFKTPAYKLNNTVASTG
jgi:IS30 family transposase